MKGNFHVHLLSDSDEIPAFSPTQLSLILDVPPWDTTLIHVCICDLVATHPWLDLDAEPDLACQMKQGVVCGSHLVALEHVSLAVSLVEP